MLGLQAAGRSIISIIITAACLLAAGGAQASPAVGDTVSIPAITLIDGQQLPAGHFDGKPVIIEYWASWCPFCARQNPYLQRLYDTAHGRGLEILTVSIDEHESDARNYLDEHGYTFPVTMETPELLEVFGKRRVIPMVFVITPDGKVAEAIPGEMFEEDVLELINYAP